MKPASSDVEISLQMACDGLSDLPQSTELTTEQILLGLAMADHQVGVWLRQQGLDPRAMAAEIRRLYGCAPPAKSARD